MSGISILIDRLGGSIQHLLSSKPFSDWEVTRSVEEDLPEKQIWYEFMEHGVEVICDAAERIRTIFLHRGDAEALIEIPFSLSRAEVLARFGVPENSGSKTRIAALGDRGAWDRFALPSASVHVQYRLDRDEIDMITLMAPGVAP